MANGKSVSYVFVPPLLKLLQVMHASVAKQLICHRPSSCLFLVQVYWMLNG